MRRSFFQRLILPGLIFQSTMIGGGYATGRELVEFFLLLGPQAALVAMLLATVAISLIASAAFEFARQFRLYDYRCFFRKLLGPGWFLFEIIYISMMILVLAVIGSAAGEMAEVILGVPQSLGTVSLMVVIGILLFYGSTVIERFLSWWSLLLYCTYAILIAVSFMQFGDNIRASFFTPSQPGIDGNVIEGGLTYAGYNAMVFTAVLFVVRYFQSARDAVTAGMLCGPLSMIPGVLLIVAMFAHYPDVNDQALPVSFLLGKLQSPQFLWAFNIVIFGTLIETGTALLHSVNERLSMVYREKQRTMPTYVRPLLAAAMLAFAIYLAGTLGIIALIGQGYAYATYAFLAVVIIPLFTRGIFLAFRQRRAERIDFLKGKVHEF